jgi:hypothetical protein
MDEPYQWTACNEITQKLIRVGSPEAIGWAMLIEGHGWFGRIGKVFSFGPTTKTRAQHAVEANLKGEPFDKLEGENSWSGTCWKILSGSGDGGKAPAITPASSPRERLTSLGHRFEKRSDVGGGVQGGKPALDDMVGLMAAEI